MQHRHYENNGVSDIQKWGPFGGKTRSAGLCEVNAIYDTIYQKFIETREKKKKKIPHRRPGVLRGSSPPLLLGPLRL